MTVEEIDIDFVKNWLERGDIQKLAHERGIDRQTAYLILAKKRKNFAFLELCYKRALERSTKFLAFEQQKNILMSKINSL